MGTQEDNEEREIQALYPEGTLERKVLDYSRASHTPGKVPPLLLGAFRLLMGITLVMTVSAIVAFLNH